MFRKCIVALVVLLVAQLMVSFLAYVPTAQAAGGGTVVFSLFNSSDLSAVTTRYQLSGVKPLFTPNSYLASVTSKADPATVAVNMEADYRVDTASPNYDMLVVENGSYFTKDGMSFKFDPATGSNVTTSSGYTTARSQWAWQKTQLSFAQQFTLGKGITVAILDTGVDFTHYDLATQTLPGYDALGIYPDGRDVQGHGTFIAGIIHQIAPQATILPVRVLDANGLGTVASVMNGLQYAINQGAKVVNLSFSSTMDASSLHKLIQTAKSKGVMVFAAAGNDNSGAKYFPANYGESLAVSATDNRDYRANFANWQGYMDISSPGVDIYSTWLGGGYAWASGTSFSTPIVAGAAALIRSFHPDYSYDQVKSTLNAAVDKFGVGCSCGGMGAGRLNFSKLR
jgi:thermitase